MAKPSDRSPERKLQAASGSLQGFAVAVCLGRRSGTACADAASQRGFGFGDDRGDHVGEFLDACSEQPPTRRSLAGSRVEQRVGIRDGCSVAQSSAQQNGCPVEGLLPGVAHQGVRVGPAVEGGGRLQVGGFAGVEAAAARVAPPEATPGAAAGSATTARPATAPCGTSPLGPLLAGWLYAGL